MHNSSFLTALWWVNIYITSIWILEIEVWLHGHTGVLTQGAAASCCLSPFYQFEKLNWN